MTPSESCPECGAPLPSDAPAGLCPACLMSGAIPSQPASSTAESASRHREPSAPDDTLLAGGHTPRLDDHRKKSAADPRGEPAAVIGRYKLVRELGKGGFGVVWEAEQTEPIRRGVALKIIKPGMDSREVIARFEAERQILALMDHPNIAAVLDAGTTDRGLPYFVMELVKGVPITEYCDSRKLGIRARLELFIPVCQAVQHAHQKAILHRDLKPSNILVTEVDGKPAPKVIDFGIAKAMGASPAEMLPASLALTEAGMFVGTPQYMSPEQAGSMPDVDTRSDIYTLGVILYELLVGETPLSSGQLKKAAWDEVLRLIREGDPPRPSSRFFPASELAKATANLRHTEPKKLGHTLRGDLDWIVLKALEKDRALRYDTANAFGQDLQRHLNHEPVSAGPPRAGYRLRKLVRRNRLAVGAAACILALLTAGITASTWQAVRATKAENLAEQDRDRARKAEQEAQELKNKGDELLWEASKSDSEESLRKLAADDWNTAVAYGARALRIRPGNAAAAQRLFGQTVLAGMAPSRILAHAGAVTQALFLPDSTALLTVSGETLRRWEPSGKNRWISHEMFAARKGEKILALSPTGDRLCLLAPDGSARLWDPSNGGVGATLVETNPSAVVFSPDGKWLLTMHGAAPTTVWDARIGTKVATLACGDPVTNPAAMTAGAMAPDGSSILLGTITGVIYCWKQPADGRAWNAEWVINAIGAGVEGMTISPDGSRFTSVSRDGAASSWTMAALFQVASFKGEQATACVAYSTDGAMVATGGVAGSVELWERFGGKRFASLRGHRGSITALSFSGDGRFLLSASEDGTARVWEVARCPLASPEGMPGEDTALSHIPPVPGWVYEGLLPFLCGRELDREGKISDLSVSRQLEAQSIVDQRIENLRAESSQPASPWDRFLAWKLLSDCRTRLISPGSMQTVSEFVEKNLWDANKLAPYDSHRTEKNLWNVNKAAPYDRLRAVWMAAPSHPLAQWALGRSDPGIAWHAWLRDRAQRRLADPATGALYGAETVVRWSRAEAAADAAESQAGAELTNSLGMKLTPVAVSGGKRVLFSIWDTRVKDYAAYAAEQAGVDGAWRDPVFEGQKVSPTEDSPVVEVSWEDANGFCHWLTARERALGKITGRQRYRLPTDEEWSWAVGIGEEEEEALRGRSPNEKDSKIRIYPWGTFRFPPVNDEGKPLGNYADTAYIKSFPHLFVMPGFTDGYATTSPVGTFPAGAHGLYDMSGNVWEWCDDFFDPLEKKTRVVRGGSWGDSDSDTLLSSCRHRLPPGNRNYEVGFRCVLAEDSSAH